jgi:hypothetical protein
MMGITFGKDGGDGHKQSFKPPKEVVEQAIKSHFGGIVPPGVIEGISKAFEEAREHRVQIWYWKTHLMMTSAFLGSIPKPWKELRPSYALMWQGIMGWNGSDKDALNDLFTTFQDEGTGPFFSQAEVARKLQPHPHTSMSVGDVVAIDGNFYLCLPNGWEELEP